MGLIDEIEELRAELRHCHLSAKERRSAEIRLAELAPGRNDEHRDATTGSEAFRKSLTQS